MVKSLVTIRANKQIIYLFKQILRYHKGANRTEIVNWALQKMSDNLEKINWEDLSNRDIKGVIEMEGQPQFMNFRVNTSVLERVNERIKREFSLEVVQRRFLLKLALVHYLDELDDKRYPKEALLKEVVGDVWSKDPDDTQVARQFYLDFWKSILDQQTVTFRGETIISFNTIAGAAIRLTSDYKAGLKLPKDSANRLKIIVDSPDLPYSIKEDFKEFHKKYHSLANFMPVVKIEDFDDIEAYLQYVKARDYHDFPDLFFEDIKNYYLHEKGNEHFHHEINKLYFNLFGKGKTGWKQYVEHNYLQDFFVDEEYIERKRLAPPTDLPFPYRQHIVLKLSYEEREACLNYIGAFLKNALQIIDERAKRLADSF